MAQCLPHIAEPKVDAVSGQTNCRKIQIGPESHRLQRTETNELYSTDSHSSQRFSLWPAGCCCCGESGGFAGTSASSAHLNCGSVSLPLGLPHRPGMHDAEGIRCSGRLLSPVTEKKCSNQLTETAPASDCNVSVSKIRISQTMMAFPHLTCMLHCGCSTRYWLSPVGGLLDLLLHARGCGLSTEKGGWVPSLKWRGISLLFLSCRVCVASKSRTRNCEAKWPEKWPLSTTGQKYCTCTSCVHVSISVL